MDPDLRRARNFIEEKILGILLRRQQQRQPQPVNDAAKMKAKDVAKRLEEGLFKIAITKESYMNLDTLESRLHAMIKSTIEQRYPEQSVNSSSANTGTSSGGSSIAPTNPDREI